MVCPPDGIGLAKYYTMMPDGSCTRQASFFENKNILSLGFGYAVVLGLGLFFSVFTAALVSCAALLRILCSLVCPFTLFSPSRCDSVRAAQVGVCEESTFSEYGCWVHSSPSAGSFVWRPECRGH